MDALGEDANGSVLVNYAIPSFLSALSLLLLLGINNNRENDMKSIHKFGKSVSIISAATLVSMASMSAMADKPQPHYYSGTATLCALVNPSNVTAETKGNNGVTYTYNQVLLFRIVTDSPLVTGWEVLTSNTKSPEGRGGYNWGEAVLTPDLGAGELVDEFKFPVKQADSIRGTYIGTGDFEGIAVDYALGPFTGGLPACDAEEVAALCENATYVCAPMPPGPGIGYYISGVILD